MSTKSTIYYNEKETGIHLYEELLDDTIHLEFEIMKPIQVSIDIELKEEMIKALVKQYNQRQQT